MTKIFKYLFSWREMWEVAVCGQHGKVPAGVHGLGPWRGAKPLTGIDGLKRNGIKVCVCKDEKWEGPRRRQNTNGSAKVRRKDD